MTARSSTRMRDAGDPRVGVNTLVRGLRVLEAVVEEGPEASLAEVTARVELPKTTVHRLLKTLVDEGYVEARGGGSYQGGTRVLAVAGRVLDTVGYARLIEPVLRELEHHTDETIHFGVFSGLEAIYVWKLKGRRPYEMGSQVGKPLLLHSTAIGKAILSFLPDAQRQSIIDQLDLSRRTDRTITTRRGIEEEATRTRERGYSLDDEENEEGIRCIGVPVFDYTVRVIGGISVSAPTFHLSLDDAKRLSPALLTAGRKASQVLGAPSHLLVLYEGSGPAARLHRRSVGGVRGE